jgi:hypothetical protein
MLSACGAEKTGSISNPPTDDPATATAQPTTIATESTPPPLRTGLKAGRSRHAFKAGGVTVNVDYSAQPVEKWAPGTELPLNVSLTASSRGGSKAKIYLSKVTAFLYLTDVSGPIDSPEPIVDTPNIDPGYLVTSPTSYTQVFVLPAAPAEATGLTISFRYEMLLAQPNSSPRDFAKRSATDTLLIFRR